MKNKLTIIVTSALALASTSLFAQMTTTETTTTETTPVSQTTTTETTSSYAPGHVIVDSTGAKLGTVERVITRKSGDPRLIVVNTGERSILVPRNVLTVSGENITYSGKPEWISSAPVFEESHVTEYQTREAVAPIYKHYEIEDNDDD